MDYDDSNFSNINESDALFHDDVIDDIPSIQKVEGNLSKRFVSIYKRNDAFHDWYLDKFEYLTSQKQRNDRFCIHISHTNHWPQQIDKRYLLTFYGIKNMCMNMNCVKESYLYYRDEYLYDKWYITQKNKIGYKLFMASSNTISLICSGVRIEAIKSKN